MLAMMRDDPLWVFFHSNSGLHWEALDEDVSITGLLAGKRDRTGQDAKAA